MKVFLEAFIFILVFLKTHLNSGQMCAYPALVYSKHSIKPFCVHRIIQLNLHSNREVKIIIPYYIPKETGDQRGQISCL